MHRPPKKFLATWYSASPPLVGRDGVQEWLFTVISVLDFWGFQFFAFTQLPRFCGHHLEASTGS